MENIVWELALVLLGIGAPLALVPIGRIASRNFTRRTVRGAIIGRVEEFAALSAAAPREGLMQRRSHAAWVRDEHEKYLGVLRRYEEQDEATTRRLSRLRGRARTAGVLGAYLYLVGVAGAFFAALDLGTLPERFLWGALWISSGTLVLLGASRALDSYYEHKWDGFPEVTPQGWRAKVSIKEGWCDMPLGERWLYGIPAVIFAALVVLVIGLSIVAGLSR